MKYFFMLILCLGLGQRVQAQQVSLKGGITIDDNKEILAVLGEIVSYKLKEGKFSFVMKLKETKTERHFVFDKEDILLVENKIEDKMMKVSFKTSKALVIFVVEDSEEKDSEEFRKTFNEFVKNLKKK